MGTDVFKMVWWVVGLPVFGFLIQALLGKMLIDSIGPKYGRKVVGALAVLPIAASFAICVSLTRQLVAMPADERLVIQTLFEWITVGNLSIPFEFRIDALSMTMTLIITGIGSLIHLYAVGYMAEEKDFARFFTYLNLFVAMMLTLVLGNNLVLLFVGWEGVGVCSYLLIGFWYQDVANSKAANKAFIVNRIGDFGLCLGLFLIVFMLARTIGNNHFHDPRWLSYDVILPNVPVLLEQFGPGMLSIACFLLFIGAMGKSAQFPLYVWLPDAMAGPTPVSALIHAATMVTSGVFLLNRMSPMFHEASWAGPVVALVGAFTALIGALIAFGQTDIKKVLAFSTVSQLGYMFVACGVGAYWVGLFHVTTHAFFKALLFLGSGAVIHAMAHEQDMRFYGQLRKYLPITALTMIVGWLAIAGFPFMAGFFSKEQILHSAFDGHLMWGSVPVGTIVGAVSLGVAALTAAYMTRMTMMTFYSGSERWRTLPEDQHDQGHHGHEHDHDDHVHHTHHDHGPDTHGFLFTEAELARRQASEPVEHHHHLDKKHKPHEVPWTMWVPLAALAVMSLFGGAWLEKGVHMYDWLASANAVVVEHHGHGDDHSADHGDDHATDTHAEGSHSTDDHAADTSHGTEGNWIAEAATSYAGNWMFWASIAAFAVGVGYGVATYGRRLPENDGMDTSKWNPLRKLAGEQFYYDKVVSDDMTKGSGVLATFLAAFDKKVVDGTVVGVGKLAQGFGRLSASLQRGYVRGYAVWMQVGIVALLIAAVVLYTNMGGGQ